MLAQFSAIRVPVLAYFSAARVVGVAHFCAGREAEVAHSCASRASLVVFRRPRRHRCGRIRRLCGLRAAQ